MTAPVRETTRLAPSPTGALHLGNARTFLVNWALARREGWRIVLRIEDLDTPRVKSGAIDQTIDLLSWLGIDWDEGPYVQSRDRPHHEEAMHALCARGMVYPCEMSRSEILAAASAPQEGSGEAAFPAALRPSSMPREFLDEHTAWRFATPDESVSFVDMFAGEQVVRPSSSVGDFVVWTRRDGAAPGQASYQLAVVVDDARQGVTRVIRGDDLIDSTGRQILLSRALGLSHEPRYCHLPLARGSDGRRLAKRHGDTRLDTYRARGVRAQRVIGLCAHWCGLTRLRGEMSALEFRDGLDLRTIPRGAVTYTPEDDAWLLGT
jgi:glutamyl-tRNA synthetase